MSRYNNTVPQILDGNGVPIVGAKKFFFEPGTTTKKTIYSDAGLTTATDNPQLSDASGRYSGIFLDGIYKEVQQDNSGTATGFDGVTIWTEEEIGSTTEGNFELWVSSNTYNIPEIVLASDDDYYISLTDGNQGNDPTSSPANWGRITLIIDDVISGVDTISDANGNELLEFGTTASAVNEVTITNAATGNQAKIQGTGEAAGAGLIVEGTGTNSIVDINATGTGNVNLTTSTGDVTINDVAIEATPSFLAYRSASYTHTNGNVVQYNTEGFDITSDYDTGTYRFTPSVAGKYFVYAQARNTTPNTDTSNTISIRKNGTIIKQKVLVSSGTTETDVDATTITQMNGSTDYVDIQFNAVGTITVDGTLDNSTFMAYRIQV